MPSGPRQIRTFACVTRENLHYEHWSTVGDIRRALEDCEAPAEVLRHLHRMLKIAWITKEENATLTQLGFRTKRPDPAGAYLAAGIEMVATSENTGWSGPFYTYRTTCGVL
jgi:hypothetical protein